MPLIGSPCGPEMQSTNARIGHCCGHSLWQSACSSGEAAGNKISSTPSSRRSVRHSAFTVLHRRLTVAVYRPDTAMPTEQTLGKLCENSLAEVGWGMGRLDAAGPIDRHRVKGAIEPRHMSVRLMEARSGHLVESSAESGNEVHVWLTKLDDLRVAPEPRSTLRLTEGAIVLRSSRLRCSNGDLSRHLIAHVPKEVRRACKNRGLASQVRLGSSGRSNRSSCSIGGSISGRP